MSDAVELVVGSSNLDPIFLYHLTGPFDSFDGNLRQKDEIDGYSSQQLMLTTYAK